MILMGGCGYMRMVGDEFRRSVAAVDFRNGGDSPAHLKKADSVLMGRVNGTAARGNPVAVTAFSMPDGSNSAIRPTHLVDYNLLPGPGPYALFVPEGAYTIATFIDTNRNYILEENEFAGYYGNPDAVAIKGQAVAKDLDITLKDGTLIIKGEKKSESEDKSDFCYCSERSYGSFERSVSLPSKACLSTAWR